MILTFSATQELIEYAREQKTGCLHVTDRHNTAWRVFFSQGKLQYADCSVTDPSQLQNFLFKHGWTEALKVLKKMPQDASIPKEVTQDKQGFDQAMAWIWLYQGLDRTQLQQLIQDISRSALENLLWLQDGTVQRQDREPLPSWIQMSCPEGASLSLEQTIRDLQQRQKQWKNTSQIIKSPHQRLTLPNGQQIPNTIKNGTLSPNALGQLAKLLHQDLSLRQLSFYLKQDEIAVARLLIPYIEGEVMHLLPPHPQLAQLPPILRDADLTGIKPRSSTAQTYKIICIDDSPIMLTELKRFLGDDQYEVTTIDNPIKASATIFQLKPDLILLDITMPKINGYRLCSLLRNSAMLDQTPIIMVTGNTGLIDKARAKICGATGYLTKPFTQQALLDIVNKHLN